MPKLEEFTNILNPFAAGDTAACLHAVGGLRRCSCGSCRGGGGRPARAAVVAEAEGRGRRRAGHQAQPHQARHDQGGKQTILSIEEFVITSVFNQITKIFEEAHLFSKAYFLQG